MTLNELLDDIQGNVSESPSEIHLPDDETAPEQVNESAGITPADDSLAIDLNHVQSLENFKQYRMYRKAVEEAPSVSKSFATEVFTMLHDFDAQLLGAKMTAAASAHNKSLLISELDKYQRSLQSLSPMITHIASVVEHTKQTIEALLPVVDSTAQELDKEMARTVSSAIVVFCRKSYDLWNTPIKELIAIDDRLIDFAPYEGKLTSILSDVYYSQQAGDRLVYDTSTMSQIVNMIISYRETLPRTREELCRTYAGLTSTDSECFTKVNFNQMLNLVEWVSQTKALFDDKSGLIQKLYQFVHLLK